MPSENEPPAHFQGRAAEGEHAAGPGRRTCRRPGPPAVLPPQHQVMMVSAMCRKCAIACRSMGNAGRNVWSGQPVLMPTAASHSISPQN